MLCEICHAQEATVLLLQSVQDKQVSLHICEECAQKRQLSDMLSKPALVIHELLASLLQLETAHGADAPDITCQGCGLHYSQFRQLGRFGCAQCYASFKERLLPLLRQFHHAEEHRGRQQEGPREDAPAEIARLKSQLQAAIAEEKFETAAALRDRIQTLQARSKT